LFRLFINFKSNIIEVKQLQEVIDYINANKEKFIEELKEILRIPSVSTLPEHNPDMIKCAELLVKKLTEAGLSRAQIYQTEGHPLVYGEWLGAPGKPTVLIYGHYDVQPADPLELWDSPPFEPIVKNGKIYARGATDDKGQMFMHVKCIEAYFKTLGSLPLNVKFIIEGEEEVASEHLEKFITQNTELLKCDTVLISDTGLYENGVPTLSYGLRGLTYMEVEVEGPNRDLHSGEYGGAVINPINALAEMITKLHDKNGKVSIPGFYKNVEKLSKTEKADFNKLKFSEKKFAKSIGLSKVTGEKGYSTLERLWVRPTLDCNGIIGGFTGRGAKTVIPSKAKTKISMRLVPNQNPKRITKLFTKYIKEIAPSSLKVTVRDLHSGAPCLISLKDKAIEAASRAMEEAFGKKTIFIREGGSIPVVSVFSKRLKVPSVLMGMGLASENIHSPNEHFNLHNFELGIKSSAYFMNEYSQ
jgi:acetylornithine deacetylase/succinyl-diaminopimelate desuccinylase-like protein